MSPFSHPTLRLRFVCLSEMICVCDVEHGSAIGVVSRLQQSPQPSQLPRSHLVRGTESPWEHGWSWLDHSFTMCLHHFCLVLQILCSWYLSKSKLTQYSGFSHFFSYVPHFSTYSFLFLAVTNLLKRSLFRYSPMAHRIGCNIKVSSTVNRRSPLKMWLVEFIF